MLRTPQAKQLVRTGGFLMGDLSQSLAEAFVQVDDAMMQPEAAMELLALRDGSLGAPGG